MALLCFDCSLFVFAIEVGASLSMSRRTKQKARWLSFCASKFNRCSENKRDYAVLTASIFLFEFIQRACWLNPPVQYLYHRTERSFGPQLLQVFSFVIEHILATFNFSFLPWFLPSHVCCL